MIILVVVERLVFELVVLEFVGLPVAFVAELVVLDTVAYNLVDLICIPLIL